MKQSDYTQVKTITGTILIVDDEPLARKSLEAILSREGHIIKLAESGEEAIEMINHEHFALIISDQKMPGISGIEVLQHAKRLCPDTFRILLTGVSDEQTAIEAINIGEVTHYLTKPWDNNELVATTASCIDKYKLIRENRILQKLIERQNRSLKHEVKVGTSIHRELLVGRVPKNIPGISIAASSLPSKEIDGDFFEFYKPTDEVLDVALGDVMGKGVAAALMGTAVKSQLIRFALPFTSVKSYDDDHLWKDDLLGPDEIMEAVHKEIAQPLIDLEYFVTLFYCRINQTKKTLSYVNLGAPPPIHFSSKRQSVTLLEKKHYPLGFQKEEEYNQEEISFETGDFFLFYSDGVTEARSKDKRFFGQNRLVSLAENSYDLSPDQLLKKIKDEVDLFTDYTPLQDDLTVVVVKITDYIPHESDHLTETFPAELVQLDKVRSFIRNTLSTLPPTQKRETEEIELAVNEIFCNIVKHGYENIENESIKVRCRVSEEEIIVMLSDRGESFNPEHIDEPDLTGSNFHGYGLHIIKQVADRITYHKKRSKKGWNHLTIHKRRNRG